MRGLTRSLSLSFLLTFSIFVFVSCQIFPVRTRPQESNASGSLNDLRRRYYLASKQIEQAQCEAAIQNLRELLIPLSSRLPELSALAHYQLGLAYECVGDQLKAIASYNDAFLRKERLPPMKAELELPARMASAYLRVGEKDAAENYFQMAEQGFAKWKSKDRASLKDLSFYKALYEMGVSYTANLTEEDLPSFISSLSSRQIYLLRLIDEEVTPFSNMALEELERSLDHLIELITAQAATKLDEARSNAEALKLHLSQLKTNWLPTQLIVKPEQVKALKAIERVEWSTTKLMHKSRREPPLTPEAEKLQGLKREGFLTSP